MCRSTCAIKWKCEPHQNQKRKKYGLFWKCSSPLSPRSKDKCLKKERERQNERERTQFVWILNSVFVFQSNGIQSLVLITAKNMCVGIYTQWQSQRALNAYRLSPLILGIRIALINEYFPGGKFLIRHNVDERSLRCHLLSNLCTIKLRAFLLTRSNGKIHYF